MTKRDHHDDRLLEALRHEIAKQELEDYEPTAEELREAAPAARYWRARVAERRRENIAARAAGAVELPAAPNLAARSREWLLGRLAELRELASALPGGAQLAHRNLDAQALEDLPTEEIRSHVADLEAAIAAAMPTE